MLPTFALAMFLAAVLSFSVQPMVAKMVLPLFGGTSAVWSTCMVCFQALLLGGYGYAHLLGRRGKIGVQLGLHLAFLAAAAVFLPIRIEATVDAQRSPALELSGLLLGTVGAPFLMVTTTAPLLQRWFARTDHPTASDPYYLYGASNLGSMLALLAYPLVIEPRLRLLDQTRSWAVGYGVLVLLAALCGVAAWRAERRRAVPTSVAEEAAPAAPIPWLRRLRWIALSLVPSSLMLGVTTYVTTDIASMPLLWVLPLALYLLTFVLVFARRLSLRPDRWASVVPFAAAATIASIAAEAVEPMWLLVPLHIVTFFVIAMACHGALAADRPPATQLTEYYLWLSVGGVLGGAFNALAAPALFDSVAEYPIVLVLACLLARPRSAKLLADESPEERLYDLALPIAFFAFSYLLGQAYTRREMPLTSTWFMGLYAVPLLLALYIRNRRLRFAGALAAVLVSASLHPGMSGDMLLQSRSFYTALKVSRLAGAHRLIHGRTLHGRQRVDSPHACEPRSYYSRQGPIGDVIAAVMERRAATAEGMRVGVIGLGVGELATYAGPGQRWTFYEIDAGVARIARDKRFFTFLDGCASAEAVVDVQLGDGRLVVAREPPSSLDLLAVDAFSSDAIPIHLLTREAVAIYLERLTPDGVLAFHISNRHFDLAPVLGAQAMAAGVAASIREDLAPSEQEQLAGTLPSIWVAFARRPELLPQGGEWRPLAGAARPWSDDYSDPIGALRIFH